MRPRSFQSSAPRGGQLRRLPVVAGIALSMAVGCPSSMPAQTMTRVRLTAPRVKPVIKSEWNEAQRRILEARDRNGTASNVFTTVARNPELAEAWLTFAGYILGRSNLPVRDREMLILRIGWLCQAEYEWGQHSRIAIRGGLSEEEVTRITKGPDAAGWNEFDRLLLRSVDELHRDAFISDRTWNGLAARYNEKQMMDLVFTVGEYNLVSMALNSFGVQLDAGVKGFPPAP